MVLSDDVGGACVVLGCISSPAALRGGGRGRGAHTPPQLLGSPLFPHIERREIGVSQYLVGVSSALMSSQLLSVI